MTLREFIWALREGPHHRPVAGELRGCWETLAERDAREANRRFANLGLVATAISALAVWYVLYQIFFRPWVGP